MRVGIESQGIAAIAETHPDGTLTLTMLNSSGQTLAVGTWAEVLPPEAPRIRSAEVWPESA